jgi:hypothetical protein
MEKRHAFAPVRVGLHWHGQLPHERRCSNLATGHDVCESSRLRTMVARPNAKEQAMIVQSIRSEG